MKFKFDAIAVIGIVMGLVLLQNAILYGGDIAAASGYIAAAGEWIAIIALFGLGIWAMIERSPAPKIQPVHHQTFNHHPEKKIEG